MKNHTITLEGIYQFVRKLDGVDTSAPSFTLSRSAFNDLGIIYSRLVLLVLARNLSFNVEQDFEAVWDTCKPVDTDLYGTLHAKFVEERTTMLVEKGFNSRFIAQNSGTINKYVMRILTSRYKAMAVAVGNCEHDYKDVTNDAWENHEPIIFSNIFCLSYKMFGDVAKSLRLPDGIDVNGIIETIDSIAKSEKEIERLQAVEKKLNTEIFEIQQKSAALRKQIESPPATNRSESAALRSKAKDKPATNRFLDFFKRLLRKHIS